MNLVQLQGGGGWLGDSDSFRAAETELALTPLALFEACSYVISIV